MCASAEISFSASALLGVSGVMAVRRAAVHDRSMLLFAYFPILFAAHQFTEGLVWLEHEGHLTIDVVSMRYVYIGIAFLVWPILSPLAALQAARSGRAARTCVRWCLVGGVALNLYQVVKLLRASRIDVVTIGHSLSYQVQFDRHPPAVVESAYAFLVLVPLFLTSRREVRVFGIGVGVAFGVTFLLLSSTYFSVWCFLSAALSALLLRAIAPGTDGPTLLLRRGTAARERMR